MCIYIYIWLQLNYKCTYKYHLNYLQTGGKCLTNLWHLKLRACWKQLRRAWHRQSLTRRRHQRHIQRPAGRPSPVPAAFGGDVGAVALRRGEGRWPEHNTTSASKARSRSVDVCSIHFHPKNCQSHFSILVRFTCVSVHTSSNCPKTLSFAASKSALFETLTHRAPEDKPDHLEEKLPEALEPRVMTLSSNHWFGFLQEYPHNDHRAYTLENHVKS